MPASHLTGSSPFGPINAATRTYSHTIAALPNGDWCIGFQFRADVLRGNGIESLWERIGINGLGSTGGNDYWIHMGLPDYQSAPTWRRKLVWKVKSGNVELTASAGPFIGTTDIVHGVTYWVILQRTGSTIEFWVVPVGGTATTPDTSTAYNTASPFGTKTLQAGEFGYKFRGNLGTFFFGSQALSTSDITSIAGGADPDTIITLGNRKSYFAFTGGSSLTNDWGGAAATQAGTWTNQIAAGPLQPLASTNLLFLNDPRPYTPYPTPFAGGNSVARLSGKYYNYTPTGAEYQILLASNLSVITAWTAFTSFSASAGNWLGRAFIPEGGPYILQIRDASSHSISYNSSSPLVACATMATTGQSPMTILDTTYKGLTALTASDILFGWFQSLINTDFFEPYNAATVDAGAGFAALANQFYSDSGGKPVALIACALVGSSISDWAGYQEVVLNSVATYTVGETINIIYNGAVVGTATVFSSSGTSLKVKWASCYIAMDHTQTGTWSSGSQSITISAQVDVVPGMLVTGTNIDTNTIVVSNSSTGANITISKPTLGAGAGTSLSFTGATVTGLSSGLTRTITTEDAIPSGYRTNNCYPGYLAAIDGMNVHDCDLLTEFLNGAADAGSLTWGTRADYFYARYVTDMTSRNINYRLIVIPHNRQTDTVGGASEEIIRTAQYNWAVNHPDYLTKVFVGVPIQDWQLTTEGISKNVQTSASNSTTKIQLAADFDGSVSDVPRYIELIGGTNSPTTRTDPGTSWTVTVGGLLTLTGVAALSAPCDNTTVYNIAGTGPHENRYGAPVLGTRMGRDMAKHFSKTSIPATGPVIKRFCLLPNTNGTKFRVEVVHPIQGRSLRTPSGGTTAATVFGFAISNDNYSTTKTISSVAIISSTVFDVTMAVAPTLSGLQIKHLTGCPINHTSIGQLVNLPYDDTGFSGNGNPVAYTPAPINVAYDFSASMVS